MRIERAIDAFLDWRQLERDATPRSLDSYRRILWRLAADYPDVSIATFTTADLRAFIAHHWRDRSAATRSNVTSVLHSFFAWAEAEDLVEEDPSRRIRRPPKRKPDVYRPSLEGLNRIRAAARMHERPAILLLEGAGLRSAELRGCRWSDVDLTRGRVRIIRKGQHWRWLPLDPDVVHSLRISHTSFNLMRTITFSPWKLSGGSQRVSVGERERIPSVPRAHRRSCGWFGESAIERVSGISRLTSYGMASQTGSCARVAATFLPSRR